MAPGLIDLNQCFTKWAEPPPWGRFWMTRGAKKAKGMIGEWNNTKRGKKAQPLINHWV